MEAGFDNPNVSFLGSKGWWVFYIVSICTVRFFFYLLHGFIPANVAWTLLNVLHAVVRMSASRCAGRAACTASASWQPSVLALPLRPPRRACALVSGRQRRQRRA